LQGCCPSRDSCDESVEICYIVDAICPSCFGDFIYYIIYAADRGAISTFPRFTDQLYQHRRRQSFYNIESLRLRTNLYPSIVTTTVLCNPTEALHKARQLDIKRVRRCPKYVIHTKSLAMKTCYHSTLLVNSLSPRTGIIVGFISTEDGIFTEVI